MQKLLYRWLFWHLHSINKGLVMGTVNFLNTKNEVLSTANQLAIAVTRNGDLTTDASLNVLFSGSTFFYPSADAYDGIKIGLSWNAGEGGTKTAVTPIIPSSDKLAYLDVELIDLLRVDPGTDVTGHIAIHQPAITPSWIPSAPGSYYQQIKVANSGITVEVVPVSFGIADPMIGATPTADGSAGIVPTPIAGDDTKFLAGNATYEALPVFQGASVSSPGTPGILPVPGIGNSNLYFKSNGTWASVPPAGIASIEAVSNPGGNIDLVGRAGITITGDDTANTITFSLPTGTVDKQTLIWNQATNTYQPALIPVYTGSSLIAAGIAGIVSAPPAGSPNRYAAADGTWRTEGTIPGQTGGSDGSIVRITAIANTWQNATNGDSVDDLYKAGLAFKQSGEYYKSGSTITGLSGLIPNTVYYLDATDGSLTTVMPQPSPTTRRVAIGKAIAPDALIFDPGEVITG